MTEIDQAYRKAGRGSRSGYRDWLRLVDIPLRKSLRSFARQVDVEAVLQEGLLKMWVLAPRVAPGLKGDNASLRYAHVLIRRLALAEAGRSGRTVELDPDKHGAELTIEPVAPADEGLRQAIMTCLGKLPSRPGQALGRRLAGDGSEPDREVALGLGMKLNTFYKNIGRARELLARCLESHGVRIAEYLS